MIKKIIIAGFLFSALSTAALASHKQTITMCLDATKNKSVVVFSGHFGSTDHFDKGHSTTAYPQNTACASHTYSSGPKSIGFTLKVSDRFTLLTAGSSCSFLYNKSNNYEVVSDHMPTTARKESWTFKLVPMPPEGDYLSVFALECEHTTDG